MRAHNGGIKRRLALRNMAIGALSVVGLESTGMIGARGEIDIVVASAAGSPSGLGQKCSGLCGLSGLAMANFATTGIGRIDNIGKVAEPAPKPGDLIRNARRGLCANDARQLRPHVDLVRHHLEV